MSKAVRKVNASFTSIDELKGSLKKKYGESAYSGSECSNVERISTNITGLDWQLGGGIPRGRIIEIFGPESSGKTSLCLHIISILQKKGLKAWFIDAEHAIDTNHATNLGVDMDKLEITQPDSGEQALQICEDIIDSNLVDLIVVDSVAALVPQAEIDGEIGDAHVGLQARMLSQALRKLTSKLSKSKTTIIFINQLRMKIGVMFGNPETTSGGNALKFYASVRIDVRKKGYVGGNENPKGIEQKIKIIKNKVGIPFREKEYDMMFKGGYNILKDLISIGVDHGILKQGGAGYVSFGEIKLGQSEGVYKKLREDKELRVKIVKAVKDCIKE